MPKTIFVFILALYTGVLSAQTEAWSHSACIWRGLRHSWTYNHRCNRMGDYVEKKGNEFYSVHTSATGKGADSTFYNSYYTRVESPDVWFQQGSESCELFGMEGELLESTNEVMIPLPDGLKPTAFMTAVINGFDIQSLAKADKLQMFNVSIEKPEVLAEQRKIRLLIKISLVDNCQTLECETFNNKTGYSVTIHYLVVCAEKQNIFENQDFSNRSYTWDKKIINGSLNETRVIQGASSGAFNTSLVGIQSFGFTLNKAHWLVEFDNNIQPHEYKPADGTYSYDIEQSFVEWEEGMKMFSAVPEQSKFSSRRKGWLTMDMDVVFLQFKNARIKHGEIEGSMFWMGRNESPNGPNAVTKTLIK
jgi:hypothetical protein